MLADIQVSAYFLVEFDNEFHYYYVEFVFIILL